MRPLLNIVVLLLAAAVAVATDDYYALLGVPRDASTADVKRAYRQLTLTKHPDKGGDASEFARISHAYEVLSDREKRANYDQFGDEDPSSRGGGGGGGGWNPFADIFGGGFGGFRFETRGGGSPGEGPREKLDDVVVPVDATLEDLYSGRVHKVAQLRQVLCHHCRGTGAEDPVRDVKKCSACGGTGVRTKTVQNGPFIQHIQSTCDVCGGRGKVVTSTCSVCHGSKVEQEEETLTVVLEQGMADGAEIVFEQQGDEKPGAIPGDVKFVVHTRPHATFTRRGDNLHMRETIPLLDALVGFERTLTHLDGHNVTLARSEVTKPGHVMRIPGEGMPQHSTPSIHGDLFVEFAIRFPQSLTEPQKKAFRQVLSSVSVREEEL